MSSNTLASAQETVAQVPDSLWTPLWEGALILIVGLTAWAAGQPWLFASLGPTAYEQAEKPHLKSARPYNVVVGHFVGIGAGFLAMWLVHAWNAPKVMPQSHVDWQRLAAAVIAVTVTTLVNLLLHSGQPAATSTTLLIALGAFQTPLSALWLAIGVVILAIVGEPVRRLRLRKPRSQPS